MCVHGKTPGWRDGLMKGMWGVGVRLSRKVDAAGVATATSAQVCGSSRFARVKKKKKQNRVLLFNMLFIHSLNRPESSKSSS
jgi:hypothetical protein